MKSTISAFWREPSWDPGVHNGTKPDYVIAMAVDAKAPEKLAMLQRQRQGDPTGNLSTTSAAVILRGDWCHLHNTYTMGFARIHANEYERLLRWWIAIMESPDYTNPDATIEPLEVEYDLSVDNDLNPDIWPAMFNAELMTRSQKFTEARKLDDGAIFVWEPIEPWGRGFIWDPEDETWLLSPSSISHEQQIANWNNGQRTTVDDL